jgi:hypothetical protein
LTLLECARASSKQLPFLLRSCGLAFESMRDSFGRYEVGAHSQSVDTCALQNRRAFVALALASVYTTWSKNQNTKQTHPAHV